MAAWKKMLAKDRTPATTQVTDCRRPTGMPSMEARSRRSPTACTARPMSLRVNQRETPARQATDTMTATRWSAVKTTGPTCQARCQGNEIVAVAIGIWPQILRDQEAEHDQQLGEPDGGHGEDEAGRAAEAPHDHDLDRGREEDGGDQAGGQPDEVVDAREGDQADGEDGRRRAEIALGEVDDLVQTVGEPETDRHEGAEESEHGALKPDTERNGKQDQLDDQDGAHGDDRRHRGRRTPRQPQMGGQRLMPFSWRLAALANLPPRVAHMPHLLVGAQGSGPRRAVPGSRSRGVTPFCDNGGGGSTASAVTQRAETRPETVT